MNPSLSSHGSTDADATPASAEGERTATDIPVVAVAEQENVPILQPVFATDPLLSGDRHRVSAIYPGHIEADFIRQRLLAAGFVPSAVEILQALPLKPDVAGSDEVLKDMLVDGAIGTAVGTGIGAVGTAILWASRVTLFVASPLVAPLAMLGWFGGLGAFVGTAVGAGNKVGKFSELVMDAITSGNVVLIAHTQGSDERDLAKEIIGKSIEGRGDADASPTVSNEGTGLPAPA